MLARVAPTTFCLIAMLAVGSAESRGSRTIGESGVVAFERAGDIFVANVDGSGERNLTRGRFGHADDPDVSPDGTMIAFAEYLGIAGGRTVVMNVDGGGLRRVGSSTGRGGEPRWSPDGSLIAYWGLPDGRLDVVARDGTGIHTVATDADLSGFSWSPDSRQIAYGTPNGLQVVDVVTLKTRTLAANRRAGDAAWSPDGSKIVFYNGEVWVVGRDGSALRKLFAQAPSFSLCCPRWSPESSHIVFETVPASFPGPPAKIVKVDVATGSLVELTTPEFGEESTGASWSPDGSRIVYERERGLGDDRDVWVMNADGSGKVEVTFAFPLGTSAWGLPQWVPGLKRIEPDTETGATVAVRPSRVVRMAATVGQLVADQAHAFFESDKLGVWSIRTGQVRWQRDGECDGDVDLAMAGKRVAWICEEQGASFCHDMLKTATLERPRPVDVVRLNYCGLSVAGRGSLIVFSTGRKIWRLDGLRKRLLRIERNVARPLSVDEGRVLLERKDGSLEVVDPEGSVIRVFHLASRPAAAELAGDRVVVLGRVGRAERLQLYRLRDGKRVRSWPTPAGNPVEFQGAHGRLAVYVVGIAIHVIDLVNGHDRVLRFRRQAGEANARLVKAGLFYSYGEAYTSRPGRLGFIRRGSLVKLLR